VRPETAQLYIINPLTNPQVAKRVSFKSLFMTHPPTEDRIRRLQSGEWRR